MHDRLWLFCAVPPPVLAPGANSLEGTEAAIQAAGTPSFAMITPRHDML
jgi:hypothetical protein